jgi:hypothetical protein
MKTSTKQTRQALGCGYEVANPKLPPQPWSPASMSSKWSGKTETCHVYTTALPIVLDVIRARVHWEKNAAAFSAYCEGDATEQMLAAVEILDGAVNELNAWAMTSSDDGGGAR